MAGRFVAGLLAVAACGSSSSDADLVTVTAQVDGQPVSRARVYFLADDDSVIASEWTDATGTVSAPMPDGGSVSLASYTPGAGEIHTWLGVAGGDDLVYATTTPVDPPERHVVVSVPADPAAGVVTTIVITECMQTTADPSAPDGTQLDLLQCPPLTHAVVTTYDGSGVAIDAFAPPPIDTSSSGIVPLAGTYAPLAPLSVTVKNMPVEDNAFAYLALAGGARLFDSAKIHLTVAGTTGTGTASYLADMGPARVLQTTLVNDAAQDGLIVTTHPTSPDDYTVDLDGKVLADFLDAPTFSTASSRVVWSFRDDGAVPDYTALSFEAQRGDTDWTWSLVGPGDPTTGLRIPALPTDLFSFAPQSSDAVRVQAVSNFLVDGGYDAVRAHLYDVDRPTVVSPDTPDSSELRWDPISD